MNVDLGIWDKLTRIIIFLLIVAAIVAVGIWYTPVLRQNERYRKEKLALDQKIEQEQAASRKLEESLKSMQNPNVRTASGMGPSGVQFAKVLPTFDSFGSKTICSKSILSSYRQGITNRTD